MMKGAGMRVGACGWREGCGVEWGGEGGACAAATRWAVRYATQPHAPVIILWPQLLCTVLEVPRSKCTACVLPDGIPAPSLKGIHGEVTTGVDTLVVGLSRLTLHTADWYATLSRNLLRGQLAAACDAGTTMCCSSCLCLQT